MSKWLLKILQTNNLHVLRSTSNLRIVTPHWYDPESSLLNQVSEDANLGMTNGTLNTGLDGMNGRDYSLGWGVWILDIHISHWEESIHLPTFTHTEIPNWEDFFNFPIRLMNIFSALKLQHPGKLRGYPIIYSSRYSTNYYGFWRVMQSNWLVK